MKRSRTEKSPWIKSKTKPGLNMKKIGEFYPSERKISPKVTRARGSINSQKAKQLVLHLDLNESAVSKKKIMGSRRKQCYERATSKNRSGLFFVVGFFIVRNECLLAFLKLRCGTFSSVWFCFVEVRFFPFVLSFVDHG